jgi:predicted PurR-regulated permease PerM
MRAADPGFSQHASRLDLPGPIAAIAETVRSTVERFDLDLAGIALDMVRQAGNAITRFGANLVTQFFVVLLHLIVLMFALFFFLRDGPQLVRRVVELVPMEENGKGLVLVGLIDNVLRPVVIGDHAQLPILLLFLGVLGGIQIYGLIGALISPMLIACVFAFAHIYREQHFARSRTVIGQGDEETGDTS